ncbi:MAG: hypothetical protein AB2392_20855 [Neobacillus sp.]
MNIEELYLDCFRYEMSPLAHCIYHLLEEKKISLDDDVSKLDLGQADPVKVSKLYKSNVLAIYKNHVYSLKIRQNQFVFIFANSEQEAIQFYTETFHQYPLNCHEYPLDYQFARGKEEISFWDLRKEFVTFPAVAGYFSK